MVIADETAKHAYAETLKGKPRSDIPVREFDLHINDPEFAAEIVSSFDALIEMKAWGSGYEKGPSIHR